MNSSCLSQQQKRSGENIFTTGETPGISKLGFYLRFFFIAIIILAGIQVSTEIFTHQGAWQPLPGVASIFWGHLLHYPS